MEEAETITFTVDNETAERVRNLVREALGLLMRGFPPEACPRDRVQVAIRRVAFMLEDEAEIAMLHPDLRAALSEIGNGAELWLLPSTLKLWEEDCAYPNSHPPHDTAQ